MKKILLSISMLALAYTASANVPVIKSDPKIEAQVEQTLKKLTLEEKIGQMMELVTDLFGANDKNGVFYIDEHKTDSILSRYKIGSILNAPNPDFDKMCTYKITYPNFQAFSKNNLCKWVTQRLFFVSLHHVCT